LRAIHRATLEVLWVTGVRMEHEMALKLLEKNGCSVDYDEMRVRIPQGLVEDCLRKTPSSFHAQTRDHKNSLMIGGNTLCLAVAPGTQTVDMDTWEPRPATRKENYDGVTVLDALPTVHFFSPYTPYFGFESVPPCMAMLESLAARIRNSTKFQLCRLFQRLRVICHKNGQDSGNKDFGHLCNCTTFIILQGCSGIRIQIRRGWTPHAHNWRSGDGWDCTCNDCRRDSN